MSQSTTPILQKTGAYDPSLVVLSNGNQLIVYSADDQHKRGVWAKILDPDGNPILDLAGNPIDTEFQINTTVYQDHQSAPEVTILDNGKLVVTWISGNLNGGDLYGRVLNADGSEDPAVLEYTIPTSIDDNYSRGLEATALADGGYVTVWYEYHSDSSLRSVYGQVYDNDGVPQGDPFQGPDPVKYNHSEADVLGLDGGGFVITWSGNNGLWGGDATGGIFGQMFNVIDGEVVEVGGEFHVNTSVYAEQHHSKMVALPNGGFMVLWQDDDGANALRFQHFDPVGTTVGVEGTLATTVSLNNIQTEWEAINLSGGGIGVMWHDKYGKLYVQSFTTDGIATTEAALIDTGNRNGNGTNFTADLKQLNDGRLVVTWEDEPADKIYTQIVDTPPVIDPPAELQHPLIGSDPSLAALADGSRIIFFAFDDGDINVDYTGIWGQRYDKFGKKVDEQFRLNTDPANRQSVPEVTVLKDGSLVVTWMSGTTSTGVGDVYGRLLDADGKLIPDTSDFVINPAATSSTPTSTANYAREAETTALENGGFVTVWYEYHDIDTYRSVYGQVFNKDGIPQGPQFQGPDVLDPDSPNHNQSEAEVLALDGGGFVITWTDANGITGNDAGGGIFGQRYNASGGKDGLEFHVNTSDLYRQHDSKMVKLPDYDIGDGIDDWFMVLWQDDASADSLKFQQFNSAGAVGVEGTLAITESLNTLSHEWEVISLSDGGIGVMWHDSYGHLYVQSFTTEGVAITETVLIETDNYNGNGTDFTADLDQLSDGRLIVTWEVEFREEVFTQIIDAPPMTNTPIGPQHLLPTSLNAFDPSLAVLNNGNRLLFVTSEDQDSTGIWAQSYDEFGRPVGQMFQINTTTNDRQTVPEVTVLKYGNLVVTWMSGTTSTDAGEVYGRLLDAEGKLISDAEGNLIPDFAINPADTSSTPDSTADYAREAETTALSDGGFVTVWYEYHNDITLRSVYGQVFNELGVAQGPQFQGPDSSNYLQTEAEVLALDGGKFVITWSDSNGISGSDSGGGIFGQRFNSSGGKDGVEFHVNTSEQYKQHDSKMVTLPDDGIGDEFMVLWQDDASLNSLKFQHFNSAGAVGVEGTLAITVSLNTIQSEWEVINLSDGGIGVMWHDTYGKLYVQSFTTDGIAITESVLIETNNYNGNGGNFIADLDQLSDGRLIVTWEDEPINEIYTQIIDAPPVVNVVATTISPAQLSDSFVFETPPQQDQNGGSFLLETLALELDDSVETSTEDAALEVSPSHVLNSFVQEPDPFEFYT